MRPAKALSKRGGVKVRIRHVVRDTVARSLVRASARALICQGTQTVLHSGTHTPVHPHTRTHPRSDNKCRANKASSLRHSLPQGVTVCLCACVGFASPAPRFERLRKDIEHVVSARTPALFSTSSGSARSWLPSCDSVSCVRFSGQATRLAALTAAPTAQTAPTSATATTTTTSRSQVLRVFQLQLQ